MTETCGRRDEPGEREAAWEDRMEGMITLCWVDGVWGDPRVAPVQGCSLHSPALVCLDSSAFLGFPFSGPSDPQTPAVEGDLEDILSHNRRCPYRTPHSVWGPADFPSPCRWSQRVREAIHTRTPGRSVPNGVAWPPDFNLVLLHLALALLTVCVS